MTVNIKKDRLKKECKRLFKSLDFIKKDPEISIAAERNVTLKESGVEYTISEHTIDIDIKKTRKGR